MGSERCPICAAVRLPGAPFCGSCGAPFVTNSAARGLGYGPVLFQVDPTEPAPRRDPRYVLVIVGMALTFVGGFLAVVGGILQAALGTGCASASCGSTPIAWAFLGVGAALIASGVLAALVGLERGLR